MLFFIIFLSVLLIIALTAFLKFHPFLSLLLGAVFVGIATGMPLQEIVLNINEGFGGLMTSIGIVIVAGTIIGVILEKSGAAYRMAEVILRITGEKHPQLAMTLIGYIISIPVFCDSGFVILSSLSKSLAKRAKVPLASMSIALSTGLFATHNLVPPTPGPIAAAGNIGAEEYLGTIILVGMVVAIFPAAVGYLWAVTVGTNIDTPADHMDDNLNYEEIITSFGEMPSAFKSFLPIVFPILLIGASSVVSFLGMDNAFSEVVLFLGQPTIALMLGVFAAFPLLPEFSENTLTSWIGKGITDAAPILVISGAGGAFGRVISNSGVAGAIEQMNFDIFGQDALFLLIPFIIASAIKTAQGSSTAASVISSSLVAPLLPSFGVTGALPLALVVMALGAGAMTVTHVNDSYFWVVTEFSSMSVSNGYKSQTMASLLQGVVTIAVTILLWFVFV